MMPANAIWLEIVSDAGEAISRQRLIGESFLIGRGYTCDWIVDDPTVSPQHLRIARDEGGVWWIEDLTSENGTINLADGTRLARLALHESADIRIGESRIAVRTALSTIAPTRRLADAATPVAKPQAMPQSNRAMKAALIAMTLVTIAAAFSIWIKQTGESKITNYVFGVIVIPLAVCAWAGVWALVTRIVSSEGRFSKHLLVTAIALLASTALSAVFKYVDYALAFVGSSSWESILQWLVMGALLAAHLRVVAPKRFLLNASVVAALVVGVIALEATYRGERERYQPPTIVTSLLPTFFPTKAAVSPKELFERIQALKSGLEEERKKDPPPFASVGAEFD